jgi:alpha-L-rhamnosidase
MKTKLLILFSLITQLTFAQIQVNHLRCEMLENPQGIDVVQPRLSWQIVSTQRNVQQVAYEILVASSQEKLNKNEGDLWHSGKINSNASILVSYAGKVLQSRTQCYWKVKVYTNKGASSFSNVASFSVGLLNKTDWQAKWIGYDKASTWDSITQFSRLSARYFRKPFTTNNGIKKATVYIVGLGMYELYINGQKIGNQVLAPAPTDYRKSVLYNTHDVTKQLITGNNVIATVLGNGRFFTMRQDYKPKKINTFGLPKMLLQLEIEYTNGEKKTIVSDDTWKLNVDGSIRTNNEYDGEEYDATKEQAGWNNIGFNDRKWLATELVTAPEGKVIAQMSEPMKIMRAIQPISIKKLNEKYILDFGQNFSGWVKVKNLQGKSGDKITLRFAESLEKNGNLYVANLRDARVTDSYTFKGKGLESWQPSFVYHGFRYVEVSNYKGALSLSNFEGELVYDNLATIGTLQTSNATINSIYKNAWWGIASNYKGMPVDCPQRNERQPWLGDRATGAYGESFLFANQNLYAKWLNDIEEAQTVEGAIPDVAPAFWNYYSDNVTWPGTYILVADMLHKQFGDKQSIIKHYPSMKKWMNYMKDKYMKNYLVTKDKYGDWCVPPESLELIHAKDSLLNTDGALIATAYYYHLLQIMRKFQEIAGEDFEVDEYGILSTNIKNAFNQKYFNNQKKCYDNNSITSNLLPLYFGIAADSVKEAVFNNVYNKIKIDNHMHISTGVIGTQWLMRTLTQFQRSDIAYTLASNNTYPSWGYMAANGATTIWELWNGNTANPQMNSQNHVMLLGDLLIWLNENVAGIKSDDKEVAFKKIIMKPENIDGLTFAKATYQSNYGTIKSEWHQGIGQFNWHIVVPPNTSAIVYIPASSQDKILENNLPISKYDGVKFIKMEGRNAVFEIGSGDYHFTSNFDFRKGIVKNEFIFDRTSFPESHAATIAETPKGLIAAWFGGTKEGNKDVCIWISHFANNQWSEPKKVADGIINDSTRYACYNPVLYQVPNGELLLFYKIGPNVAGWKGYMIRSSDNGQTWGKREALPDGFLGPIKNKPELINSTLLCPSSTEKTGWKAHIEITKDWGKTWAKTDAINDGKTIEAIQPSILKYKDCTLQILCRSRNTTLNQSFSNDGGKTWSAMTATNLPNNNSGTDAVTLKDGRQLLVYNHAIPSASWVKGKGPRTPLNVAISNDGKQWHTVVILEDSPVSQYSYPSVIQTKDGLIHIVYTWRRERIKHVVIDPTKIQTQPIVNGKWPGLATNTGSKVSDD